MKTVAPRMTSRDSVLAEPVLQRATKTSPDESKDPNGAARAFAKSVFGSGEEWFDRLSSNSSAFVCEELLSYVRSARRT